MRRHLIPAFTQAPEMLAKSFRKADVCKLPYFIIFADIENPADILYRARR